MGVSWAGVRELTRACGALYWGGACVSFGWVCRCATQMCAVWLHGDLYGYGLRVRVGVSHGGGLFTHGLSRLNADDLYAALLAVGYPRGIYDPQNGLIYPSKYPQTTKGPFPHPSPTIHATSPSPPLSPSIPTHIQSPAPSLHTSVHHRRSLLRQIIRGIIPHVPYDAHTKRNDTLPHKLWAVDE